MKYYLSYEKTPQNKYTEGNVDLKLIITRYGQLIGLSSLLKLKNDWK